MIDTLNPILVALVSVILGMLGAYFTNWEKDIYFEYMTYIVPPIGISALFFLFFDKIISLILGAIFILGLSWYYSTKIWFRRK